MNTTNFTYTLSTDKSPNEVFEAILDVRSWWSGLHSEHFEGPTEKLNDEFKFNAGGGAHYSKQKLTALIPNKKVVWLITDGSLSFVEKKGEWIGTKVVFDINEKDGKTELVFTHEGLTPELECYDSCSSAWSQYLEQKLQTIINTGTINKL